ncbi:MAG TPA: bifunctional 23S rRNA (guanine(2069)-N(7))-methyltransferase RlmK/23S rRNA (guanine(2445)-N(2))-methyltransferase RlmL, partial [Steroidobacteraceae bacterium]|nr:bifunctional 23S rRNA (guanine(2069)-N(7))-methyltransferase RlmK/23S rRNA (guanine(2445)-N(2))-methyltransferase RlmL [Steroidobacteraceae bacterium]
MNAAVQYHFVATVPRGLSDLLLGELKSLGAMLLRERPSGVSFDGTLEAGYRACLWSRVASRVLLELAQFSAASADEFYAQLRAIDWQEHIDPTRTIACEFSGTHPAITNTHFGALRLKDAVCDRLRDDSGTRPSVDRLRPAVRLHAHANGTQITLSLDMAGEGLHRRGYRQEAGEAPLRENLAAGILLRTRWPEAAARGEAFLDPMCGSGTLAIEAALIAADRAPGLLRDYFGFLGWRGHDAALWDRLRDEAAQRVRVEIPSRIRGCDLDQRALTIATGNAQRADVAALIAFEHRPVATVSPLGDEIGHICVNPPYGERLGDADEARGVYAELGLALRARFAGWDAAVLCASADSAGALRLRSYRVHELMNGAIPVRLLRIDLNSPGMIDRAERQHTLADSAGAQMFANRLQKNAKRLAKQARQAQVSCYRVYDADMPEYAFAIDRYVEVGEGDTQGNTHLHVQEYAAPSTIEVEAARRRRREAFAALPSALEVPPERIHVRVRKRQSGNQQYQRQSGENARSPLEKALIVEEGGLKFAVNLDEYLDTGLFLDHRLTRARLREYAHGARFLNLFCYTASATVYAAAGGASSSLSLDLSNSYLEWAAENFRLNGMS